MVRSALSMGNRPLSGGARTGHALVPALSVAFASLLALLPIISAHGWWPNAGLLMLIAWRMLRADVWAAWVAAPLGLWNDLVTGGPLGLSVAVWTAFMLAMDVIDRRTMWRDYWLEWIVATLLLTLAELAQWRVAALAGAPVRLGGEWPALLVAALCFPVAAFLVRRIDHWRMGQ